MNSKKYTVDESIIKKEKELEQKKYKNKVIIVTTIISVILLIVVINIISTNKSNELAKKQLSELKCSDASNTYKKLGKLSKMENEIKECKYKLIFKLLENNEYEQVNKIFYELYDSNDGYKEYSELYYKLAEQYKNNKKYMEAARIYHKLSEYENMDEEYTKVKQLMLENSKAGDTILYGMFEQDGNLKNGQEPIEWLVLNKTENNILLISKYILKKMRFGTSYYWQNSEIRNWLNNDFYDSSFTKEEKNQIQKMITSINTDDKVFCLSSEEARLFFATDEDRIAYPTKKLIDDGFKTWSRDNSSGEWWTRSVSTAANGKGVVPVEGDGNVRSAGTNQLAPEEYTYTDIGARPTISINLKSVSDTALNMEIFGHNSNTGLDNEPYIPPLDNDDNSNKSKKTVIHNYHDCYPAKPHYVCYEKTNKEGKKYKRCKCSPVA